MATDNDILEMVEETAEKHGISLDSVKCYTNSRGGYTIRVGKKVGLEKRFLTFDVSERELLDGNGVDILVRRIEQNIRTFKNDLTHEMEINGHQLNFYLGDGFQAFDIMTGETWEFLPHEDLRFDAPAMVDEGAASVSDVPPATERNDDIPYHVKEKMMQWVVGWANHYSVDDVLDWKSRHRDNAEHMGKLPRDRNL